MKHRDVILDAVQTLRRGGVVGVPTETVYGLAGDATNPLAVAAIFSLKGRPATNPLIVHVASIDVAKRFVEWDSRATILFDRFAPGPISVVLPRRGDSNIVNAVTAGRDTVAIRIPNHPLTLELLRRFDGGLAAPSANKSNHVSPTSAAHVRAEFTEAELPLILDGGPCEVGIESTVIDLTRTPAVVLRPGRIRMDELRERIGPVEPFVGSVAANVAATSPGQHERHYSPRSPAFFVESAGTIELEPGEALLRLDATPEQAERSFYRRLRELDATSPRAIVIELPPDLPAWTALRDRILRATAGRRRG